MRVGSIVGSLALAILFQNGGALAEDCPLKQISSVDMTVGPGGNFLVPVSINGTPQKMALATAAGITNLRQDAVAAMGLDSIDASHIKLLSSNGTVSQNYTQIDFALGAIHVPKLQTIVWPTSGTGPAPFAGSLAGDFLSLYDVEMDFAGRKLNFFSKDHCPGHVVYWKTEALAVLPMTLQLPTGDSSRTGFRMFSYRGSHIIVPVSINGKDFKAALNTTSQTSMMSTDTAKFIFGITADSPSAIPLDSPDGNPEHRAFRYTFQTLTLDTVTVSNAKFVIYPILTGSKDPNNTYRTDTRLYRIDDNIHGDIAIGMDVLKKLHLYVAYGENKLYITPASPPPAATQ